jgi:hypothetical protein
MESSNKNTFLINNDIVLSSTNDENPLNYFINLKIQYINYLMDKIDIKLFEILKEDLKKVKSIRQ